MKTFILLSVFLVGASALWSPRGMPKPRAMGGPAAAPAPATTPAPGFGTGPITLGYWNFRERAQASRWLLTYVGAAFTDKRYEVAQKEEWVADKTANPMGLAFPNLPYLLDGQVKISQTVAVLRYLGRKYGLAPKTESDQQRADVVEQQLLDVHGSIKPMAFTQDQAAFDTASTVNIQAMPAKLKQLSDFLGTRPYFITDISYIDFLAFEVLDVMNEFSPEAFNGLDNLKAFMARIASSPNMARYLASGAFNKNKIYAPFAKWGGGN